MFTVASKLSRGGGGGNEVGDQLTIYKHDWGVELGLIY